MNCYLLLFAVVVYRVRLGSFEVCCCRGCLLLFVVAVVRCCSLSLLVRCCCLLLMCSLLLFVLSSVANLGVVYYCNCLMCIVACVMLVV